MPSKHKDLWMVEDVAKGHSRWVKVGVAFEGSDGSLELDLSQFPHSGKLRMRDSFVVPALPARHCRICASVLYDDEETACTNGRGCSANGDD